ncbi:LCP family protein [Marmoricola sp. OAE513]|uniref:LCP family protein n=1 Tax=Marmoricola sp. OAE513 TaxID=2817894 RepID=UPI001AE14271
MPTRTRKVLKRIGIGFLALLMVLSLAGVLYLKHLNGNIEHVDFDPDDRPTAERFAGDDQPMNVLVMGSDTREGANGKGIGGDTPGLSDTTMILHLSKNRKYAYGVSLPRDAMVERPRCKKKDGSGWSPGGLTQFNAAYALGGPACTVKTVEQLTGIRINHFIVVNFVGFKAMVNAIGGVKICVPEEVNDNVGNINLPAGTYKVTGQQALDYVRVRHDIGAPTGDIGRMKRQQTFVSAMIEKLVSAGTLANPVGLIKFLNAATNSLTTDPQTNIKLLASIGNQLKNIGLDKIKFITVPFEAYAPDPNRLQWSADAANLWEVIKKDRKLGRFGSEAVSPGSEKPTSSATASATGTPGGTPGGSATGTPTNKPTKSAEQKAAEAAQRKAEKDAQLRAAGLCTSEDE